MAIKDLAVAYNGTANSHAALRLAVRMAAKYGASITGLHVNPPLNLDNQTRQWIPDSILETLQKAEQDSVSGIKAQFREELAALGHTSKGDWIAEQGEPNRVLAKGARYFDILLVGQFTASNGVKAEIRPEDIVLLSGKPVIVVPKKYADRPFNEFAVVAWDGSRPAARALTDAMQILETKSRIDIVTVVPKDTPPDCGHDILRHLRRHGIDARQVVLPDSGGIANTILTHCGKTDPDILVMGAYSRTRIREDIFGGTTRDVLENLTVPVLMAH